VLPATPRQWSSSGGQTTVSPAHTDDRAVADADEADPLGDVEGLADGVEVPVGAGTGGEAHEPTVMRDDAVPW
jgi:hypothetical protein